VSFAVDTLAKAFAKFKQSNPEAAEKIMIVFKNSTGFCPDIANGVNGFNIEHMVKIKNLIEERENLDNLLPEGTIGIKAAGGIKTGQQSRDIQRALGNRLSMIGTSSVDNILNS
jgi:deoxyribose-phosphate aldolase